MSFDIAHLREQGQDIIIVFVASSFGSLGNVEQNKQRDALQACATSAKLAGHIVPVWKSGNTFSFIAPTEWQLFFKNSTWDGLCININKKLTCNF